MLAHLDTMQKIQDLFYYIHMLHQLCEVFLWLLNGHQASLIAPNSLTHLHLHCVHSKHQVLTNSANTSKTKS